MKNWILGILFLQTLWVSAQDIRFDRNNNRGGIGEEGGSQGARAFTITVDGKVVDADGKGIEGAQVKIFSLVDTSSTLKPSASDFEIFPNAVLEFLVGQGTSKTNGLVQVELRPKAFAIRKKGFWTYVVVTAPNYNTFEGKVKLQRLMRENEPPRFLFPSEFVLLKSGEVFKGVEVKTKAVVQKGDTTELNAQNFKVNPDATAEDLVGKLPGVSSSNGQVQAQGEQVKKVLVDGKPFFGDDPNTALKNLPAEVISKIQIYDGRSEQSSFTGFDDGNTTKTINIITKMGFKNGVFGKAFGGLGRSIDGSGDLSKYKAGLNFNYFTGDRRITFLSQMNNINEQNFSIDDIMGAMGNRGGQRGGMAGGRMFGGAGGGGGFDPGQFFVNNQGGITTTRAMGFNYSDKYGKKKNLEFTGSYFLNNTQNDNSSNTNRFYITGNQGLANNLIYLDTQSNITRNVNHRFNLRFDWKIDTFNRLIVAPRLTLQQNSSENNLAGYTHYSETPSSFLSMLNNLVSNTSTGYNGGVNVNWLKAFAKKGRTFSVQINPGMTNQDGLNPLNNTTTIWTAGVPSFKTRSQQTAIIKNTFTLSTGITFTEGLDSNHLISVSYNGNYNQNQSDRLTYLPFGFTGAYDYLDTVLSSRFVNGYSSHSMGLSYNYQNYLWNAQIGVNGQRATLTGDQTLPSKQTVDRVFYSWLPNISARYRLGMKRNLRFNYRASNNAPSVDQLQEVLNNSNNLQLTVGNRQLEQDLSHNITLRYFTVNTEKNTNAFVMVNATQTQNYITSLTQSATNGPVTTFVGDSMKVMIPTGGQLSKAVNLNGYYSLRLYGTWGKPILNGKLNMNLNGGLNYSQTPSLIQVNNEDPRTNYAKNPSASAGFVLGSNISERFDLTLTSNLTYSTVENTIQSRLNSNYISQNTTLRLNVMPSAKWVVSTDVTQTLYTGLSAAYNQTFYLWNLGMGKKFGKKNQAELRISMYDLLNQNRSISRNVTQTYYEDVKTMVLTRYIMATFTYNLRQFNGGKDKDMKMMFPGGGPPPGMPHMRPPGM